MTGPAPEDERVDDAVLRLVVDHGGSIAAEHGIGRAKARWLGLARSPEELAVQAAIKRALDPGGLLNPGVLDAWPPGRDSRQVRPWIVLCGNERPMCASGSRCGLTRRACSLLPRI